MKIPIFSKLRTVSAPTFSRYWPRILISDGNKPLSQRQNTHRRHNLGTEALQFDNPTSIETKFFKQIINDANKHR